MRVLFVNRMLSLERGGGETFDLEIARCLSQQGVNVSFLSGLSLFGAPKLEWRGELFGTGSRHWRLRTPYLGWFPWDKTKGGWRLRVFEFMWFEKRAARWVVRHRDLFDVIQTCELPYFVHSVKKYGLAKPVVMRLTAPNFYDPWGGVQKADAVMASGETVAMVRQSLRSDCHDIPNAVDADIFCPHASPFRAQHGIAPEAFVVLYVARFQDFKNHRLLIEAFSQLVRDVPAARLVLVGKGPLKPFAQQQVQALGISGQVHFLGEQPFERLPDIYAGCDVLAISSDFESFCFAALEAMAAGLPIVTTDCGWVPKLLGIGRAEATAERSGRWREGGVVVPVRDAVALARALAELHRHPDARRDMGARNRRQAIDKHGWRASAEKLLSVYRQVLEK
jgi:glycosyltransferase involved in cell wall biosynthesis